jgi:hypothetical protein
MITAHPSDDPMKPIGKFRQPMNHNFDESRYSNYRTKPTAKL